MDKSTIDIDLTSLLDVIFILLMVVMSYQVTLGDARQKEAEAAVRAQETAEAERDLAMRHLELVEKPELSVAFITLSVGYDSADPTVRSVRFMRDTQTAIEEISITPATEEAAYSRFETMLAEYLAANAGLPVLLTLDDSNILYRDHVRMSELLKQAEESHGNLYLNHPQE